MIQQMQGDMWEEYLSPEVLYVVTTNGSIKNNGEAVMGRGTAKDAARLHPSLPKLLGDYLSAWGNVPYVLPGNIATLPVKHDWRDKAADETLIWQSLNLLGVLVDVYRFPVVFLPRPGCGNGNLEWDAMEDLVVDTVERWDFQNQVVIWSL